MVDSSNGDVTVAERLQLLRDELTPAERRVVRALMADYPVAGLGPVAKLAAAAGVSAPTVVRLVTKLSFEGYADFQQSLKSEVSARLSSPLEMHALRLGSAGEDVLGRTEQVMCDAIRFSSHEMTRRYSARGGTAMSMSFSHAIAHASLANIAAR